MIEKDLRVWDIVNYDGNLVVVTEIDFTGKATITRGNGSTTHIHKDFLKNAVVGNIAEEIKVRLRSK